MLRVGQKASIVYNNGSGELGNCLVARDYLGVTTASGHVSEKEIVAFIRGL